MKFFGKSLKNANPFKTKKTLGLSLSGGGARGIAHIGAIRAFEEVGLKFNLVTGTSVGSMIGACYAFGKNSFEMEEFVRTLSDKDLIDNKFTKIGNKSENIAEVLRRFLGDVDFSELKMPFACVAVDMATGSEVVLNHGKVATAVSASSAVPVVFSPVVENNKILVDGGLLNNIPADIAKQMGANFVVSVDLNHSRGEGTTSLKMLDQMLATWRIMTSGTAYKGILNSDVLIEPELRTFSRMTVKNISQLIDEGHRATVLKLEEIKQRLQSKL